MKQRRRDFLKFLGVAGSLTITQAVPDERKRHKFPDPPQPAEPGGETVSAPGNAQAAHRAQLKLNEKAFRESLANLYDRVSELKQDMDGVHTADVFSAKLYKQTDEIEHLAKRLRSLARV